MDKSSTTLVINKPVFTSGEEALSGGGAAILNAVPAPPGSGAIVSFIEFHPSFGVEGVSGDVIPDGTPDNQILLGNVGGVPNAPLAARVTEPPGQFSDGCNPCTFASGSASLLDVGGLGGAAGEVSWGRWKGGYFVTENGVPAQAVGDFHYIYSPRITSLAQLSALTGVANFAYVPGSGTAPTDELGRAGSVLGANMQVDFGAQKVNSFSLSVSTPVPPSTARNWNASLPAAIPLNFALTEGIRLSGSCSGCASSPADGEASVLFVGPAAQRAISGYGLRDATGKNAVAGTLVLQ